MEGKSGFRRIATVDDGKFWYPLKEAKKDQSGSAEKADSVGDSCVEESSGAAESVENMENDSAEKVENLCSSTVEMCNKAVGANGAAECVTPEQKFNIQVALYEDYYKALPTDELNRILNDFRSTEVQRAAAANLRQKRLIKQGIVRKDDGLY
jgi:hypothetical protein